MNPEIASRIPLVCRPKPPGIPLARRIAALGQLLERPADADHRQLVARASGILNFAALIASDAGLPDQAADLSWRQHAIFAAAPSLDQDTAVMALMPLVNIARLLIREGHGCGAFDVLQQLYRAAQLRGATTILDHHIDLAPLIRTTEDHRKICTELWVTLLTDGARALARAGRWAEAAQATAMIDSSTPIEPWETTVAALLRICCQPDTSPAPQHELDRALHQTLKLITPAEPTTAAFRVRVGLTALDLTAHQPVPQNDKLRAAIVRAALSDAYAARDVLAHPETRSEISDQQARQLTTLVNDAALGTGQLPSHHMSALSTIVAQTENLLRTMLQLGPYRGSPPGSKAPILL